MSGEKMSLESSIALHPNSYEADVIDIRTGEELPPTSIHRVNELLSPNDENAQGFRYLLIAGVAERVSRDFLGHGTSEVTEILGLNPLDVEDQMLIMLKEIAHDRDEYDHLGIPLTPPGVRLFDMLAKHRDDLTRRGILGSNDNQEISAKLAEIIEKKRYLRSIDYALQSSDDKDIKVDIMIFNYGLRMGIESIFVEHVAPYIESQMHLPDTYAHPRQLLLNFLEPRYINQGLPGKVGIERYGGSRIRPTPAFQKDRFIHWGLEEHDFQQQNLGSVALQGANALSEQ
jgi:hypothetical protein